MTTLLSDVELRALKLLRRSCSRGEISVTASDRLKVLGYVGEVMGTLVITDSGSERLASGA